MTIKFTAKLEMPVLSRLVVPGIDEYVKETIELAAKAWVEEAIKIIPVWSGASRATLQALASAVNISVPIATKPNAPNRVSLGRLYSAGGIRKQKRGYWDFYYETNLRYLIANETKKVAPRTEGLFSSLIDPTPYQFRDAGNRAAQAVIEARMATLPPLAKLFSKRKL